MRQVVTLIGLQAGTLIWMDNVVAQTCVDTGTARWPTPEDLGEIEPAAKDSPVEAKDLALKFDNGKLTVVGEWPERIRVTSKLASLPSVVKSEGGQIHFNFDRKATYRMVAEERGEIIAVLETGDAAEPDPAKAVEIPEDWRSLHWRKKVKLASQILGEPVETVEDATAVIEAAESEIKRAEMQGDGNDEEVDQGAEEGEIEAGEGGDSESVGVEGSAAADA